MWILEGSKGLGEPITFRIAAGATKTVGRATGADFIVDAPLVSRLHCRLEASGGTLDVVDLSSTNGTLVNDQRVDRASLKNGDRLKIGRVELTVQRIDT